MVRGETWNVCKLHAESRRGDVVEREKLTAEEIFILR